MAKLKKDLAEDLIETIMSYLEKNSIEIVKGKLPADAEQEVFPAIIKTTLIFAEWIANNIRATDKNCDKVEYMMGAVNQIHKRSKEAIEFAPKKPGKPDKLIILN